MQIILHEPNQSAAASKAHAELVAMNQCQIGKKKLERKCQWEQIHKFLPNKRDIDEEIPAIMIIKLMQKS
jgi:hypothetical protein